MGTEAPTSGGDVAAREKENGGGAHVLSPAELDAGALFVLKSRG